MGICLLFIYLLGFFFVDFKIHNGVGTVTVIAIVIVSTLLTLPLLGGFLWLSDYKSLLILQVFVLWMILCSARSQFTALLCLTWRNIIKQGQIWSSFSHRLTAADIGPGRLHASDECRVGSPRWGIPRPISVIGEAEIRICVVRCGLADGSLWL
ncbi:hypothetical protein V1517DRAFT_75294 [Lipomyces orientalis]|uniref:Uncharacterized protein n=1 Tax=Lipomyces orientalis TaxID=1233043 RepID=A0ACC3TVJ3_9ASCO